MIFWTAWGSRALKGNRGKMPDVSGQGDFSLKVFRVRGGGRLFRRGHGFRGGSFLRPGFDGFQDEFRDAFQAVVRCVDALVVKARVAE